MPLKTFTSFANSHIRIKTPKLLIYIGFKGLVDICGSTSFVLTLRPLNHIDNCQNAVNIEKCIPHIWFDYIYAPVNACYSASDFLEWKIGIGLA